MKSLYCCLIRFALMGNLMASDGSTHLENCIVSRPSEPGTASLSQFPQCLGLNLLDLHFGHGELLPNLF